MTESSNDTSYIPVREAWQPDKLHGYLPLDNEHVEAFRNKQNNVPYIVFYNIYETPVGTLLGFSLINYLLPDRAEITLCAYGYPEELLRRVPGFRDYSTTDVPKVDQAPTDSVN